MAKNKDRNGHTLNHSAKDQGGESNTPAQHVNLIYQILLTLSLILNGYLAVRTERTTERLNAITEAKTKLESIKTDLETQALQSSSVPSFSFMRLAYELKTLDSQIRKGAPVPFLNKVSDFRILDNTVFKLVERQMALIHSGRDQHGTASFLMIANTGSVPAYALSEGGTNTPLMLGDLLPNSVLFIPTEFVGGPAETQKVSTPGISSLHYEIARGNQRVSKEILVPPPSAQAWTPILANVRGIGRADVADDPNQRIKNILPTIP